MDRLAQLVFEIDFDTSCVPRGGRKKNAGKTWEFCQKFKWEDMGCSMGRQKWRKDTYMILIPLKFNSSPLKKGYFKRKRSSSNQHFSGAFAVSFRGNNDNHRSRRINHRSRFLTNIPFQWRVFESHPPLNDDRINHLVIYFERGQQKQP